MANIIAIANQQGGVAKTTLISDAITPCDPDLIALSDMLGVVDCELIREKASHDLLRNWNLL